MRHNPLSPQGQRHLLRVLALCVLGGALWYAGYHVAAWLGVEWAHYR